MPKTSEIDSDIVTDLRENNEDYADLQQKISDLQQQYSFIMEVMGTMLSVHCASGRKDTFLKNTPVGCII